MVNIPLVPLRGPLTVKALDGLLLGGEKVKKKPQCPSPDVHRHVAHRNSSFIITKSPKNLIVLGSPWLSTHNPIISWKRGDLVAWSPSYLTTVCLFPVIPPSPVRES